MSNKILLIPEKSDPETQEVAACWEARGRLVRKLGKYWIKDDELQHTQLSVYGNQTFSLVLAQLYNLELISPDDSLIATLDNKWTKRNIQSSTLEETTRANYPVFVKPVIPKQFQAAIFYSQSELSKTTEGLPHDEPVLLSEIVTGIQAEARAYILNGTIKDIAFYEGTGELDQAKIFLESFVKTNQQSIPTPVIIDLAYTPILGWFILEFNACWGAGLNNCTAEKILDCIEAATKTL